jgi:hypothetical protein
VLRTSFIQKAFLAILVAGFLNLAWFGLGDTVTVWVDDAHTKKITVPKLDPDAIANKTRLSLGFGKAFTVRLSEALSVGIGISIGWSRETGIDYSKKLEELIEKVKRVCEKFNDGELSLQTYRRYMRQIFEAEDRARRFRYEMLMRVTMAAHNKRKEMDEALGINPEETSKLKAEIDEALSMFTRGVDDLPHRMEGAGKDEAIEPAQKSEIVTILEKAQEDHREAILARLQDFSKSLDQKPARPYQTDERIIIFKDYARTVRINVPKLDTKRLVDDVEHSMSLCAKYSGFCLNFDVGPRATWMLKCKTQYDESAQILILKYRQLCMEFNAGLVCLEGYVDRLHQLMEAEEKAYQTRSCLYEYMKEQAIAEMDRIFSKQEGLEKSPEADALESLAREMLGGAKKEMRRKAPPSMVKSMTRDHQAQIRTAMADFQNSVKKVDVRLGDDSDKISVWKDEVQTEKVSVSRLDTDLIAQSTKTSLSLHITWFNFGPELSWARKKGLDYGEVAQRLIIRYKQLCVDFNSRLLSLESFHRTREHIDEAIDQAAQVRERMQIFAQVLKQGSLDEMDSQFDMLDERF